jgi:SnoaL-like domain
MRKAPGGLIELAGRQLLRDWLKAAVAALRPTRTIGDKLPSMRCLWSREGRIFAPIEGASTIRSSGVSSAGERDRNPSHAIISKVRKQSHLDNIGRVRSLDCRGILKDQIQTARGTIKGFTLTVEDLVENGDKVWARSRGTGTDPRSGKPISITVIDICRVA